MIDHFRNPSPRIRRALDIADIVHDGAVRKGTEIPYINHPVAVALLLEDYGYPEPLVAAGLLHDTIEDTRWGNLEVQRRLASASAGRLPSPAEPMAFRSAFCAYLEEAFGRDVFELVEAVTEKKNDGGVPSDWLERKKAQLDRLLTANPDEAALKAADAVHNIETTARDIEAIGLGVLDRFRGGPLVVWHYTALAALASRRMPRGAPLAGRLLEAASRLESEVRRRRPPRDTWDYPQPTVV
ncbi:MAG: metal dependent phosphohydrolase [Acidobacteria bacterium]|nr:metal dependent phosphohydrolase [Acidobacteriota bacterium]